MSDGTAFVGPLVGPVLRSWSDLRWAWRVRFNGARTSCSQTIRVAIAGGSRAFSVLLDSNEVQRAATYTTDLWHVSSFRYQPVAGCSAALREGCVGSFTGSERLESSGCVDFWVATGERGLVV